MNHKVLRKILDKVFNLQGNKRILIQKTELEVSFGQMFLRREILGFGSCAYLVLTTRYFTYFFLFLLTHIFQKSDFNELLFIKPFL